MIINNEYSNDENRIHKFFIIYRKKFISENNQTNFNDLFVGIIIESFV
jgi:hypothetical protein